MPDPYIGEIKAFPFNFAPKGWALCDGQVLPIDNQHRALFQIIGTTYGGDGVNTFRVPDLRGRVPIGAGTDIVRGEFGGEEKHTLIQTEMPLHHHDIISSGVAANQQNPANNIWGIASGNPYSKGANTLMAEEAIKIDGSSQPHENMSPFLVLNFAIAVEGIYPGE